MGKENGIINIEQITNLIDASTEEWKEYIDSDENEEVDAIRKYTLLGRPLGTKDFIAKLGTKR